MTKKSFIFSTLSCAFALLISCGGIKPGAMLGKNKPYEHYSMPGNKNMYFIKYMCFEGDGYKIVMDATFYDNNIDKDSVTLNFTLYSGKLVKSIDSLSISNNVHQFKSRQFQLFFAEVNRKQYHSRFSTKIELKKYLQLFNDNKWIAKLYCPDVHTLPSTPKTKKIIPYINRHIVDIIVAQ